MGNEEEGWTMGMLDSLTRKYQPIGGSNSCPPQGDSVTIGSTETAQDAWLDKHRQGKGSHSAEKHDAEKAPLDLLPFESLIAVGRVLKQGREEYGAHNWRSGMRWGRLLAAALRHLAAWAMREDRDPKSGEPHLAHAACGLLFLISYELRGVGEDDRCKPKDG